MKKTMIRFLSLLLICTLVLSCALAEEDPTNYVVFEMEGDVIAMTGYNLPEPLVPEGTPGTPVQLENLPMSFTLPGGWILTADEPQEGFMVSHSYEPEKYDAADFVVIYLMVGDLNEFTDQEQLQELEEGGFKLEDFTVDDLISSVFAEAAGITVDMMEIKEYGSNKFVLFTIPQDQLLTEDQVLRIYMTSAVTIHKGILYQFTIVGKPENNSFYPDFEQILTSVTFAE